MVCRASFGVAFGVVELGDCGCSRDVAVAGTGLEWTAGGCRWGPLGWSRWAEAELGEGVCAVAVGSDAAVRGALLVPVAEVALCVAAQAEAQVVLSVLVAGFASVAGFVAVVVAATSNCTCFFILSYGTKNRALGGKR